MYLAQTLLLNSKTIFLTTYLISLFGHSHLICPKLKNTDFFPKVVLVFPISINAALVSQEQKLLFSWTFSVVVYPKVNAPANPVSM